MYIIWNFLFVETKTNVSLMNDILGLKWFWTAYKQNG